MAAKPSGPEKAPGTAVNEDSPLELQERLEIPRLALSIRLRLGRGGLYIFAVESEAVRQAVLKALQESVNTDAEWREIRISPERYDMLLFLRYLVQQERVSPERTIFSVTGLPETIAAQHESSPDKQPAPVVNALNIRREFIPDNNLSVVLWVDEKTRQRLPYDAKDFWAFCLETRFFHDEAARRKTHFAPPPPSSLDEEIAYLRDLRDRYRRQRPDDYGALGQVAFDLGFKLSQRSRLDEALQAFEEALAASRKENDRRREAVALNSIGNIQRVRGDLDAALVSQQEALRLAREVGDVGAQAVALGSI